MSKIKYCDLNGVVLFLISMTFFCSACSNLQKKGNIAPSQTGASIDEATLKQFSARMVKKREQLETPGFSLVVVKDDRVVYSAGFGLFDDKTPVTADTVFPWGSTTKAFTALLLLIAEEKGKLALGDSPRSCLPEFSLSDPTANNQIVIRDLVTHTSGLRDSPLAWSSGELNRAELIGLAGQAEPLAPLGTAFHWQNVMYIAAGECAANVLGGGYEQLIYREIYQPLGMHTASFWVPPRNVRLVRRTENEKLILDDFEKINVATPLAGLSGAANDAALWLRFLLAGGEIDGKRLVSKERFKQIFDSYIDRGDGYGYGLGWELIQRYNRRLVFHFGAVPGFMSLFALVPEKRIGVAVLANQQNEALHGDVVDEVMNQFANLRPTRSDLPFRFDSEPETKRTYRFPVAGPQPAITVQELEKKAARAHRSDKLNKHRSIVIKSDVQIPYEGYGGTETVTYLRPDKYAIEQVFVAFDKAFVRWRNTIDGTQANWFLSGFGSGELSSMRAEARRLLGRFNPFTRWVSTFEILRVLASEQIGDQPVYVVEMKRSSGVILYQYYSQQTGLLLKEMVLMPSRSTVPPNVIVRHYRDYREVEGLIFAHHIVEQEWEEKTIVAVKSIAIDGEVSDESFQRPSWAE